jgi:hypothetical protein
MFLSCAAAPARAVLLDWSIGGLIDVDFQLESSAIPGAINVNGVRFDGINARVNGSQQTVSLHTFFNGSGGGFQLFNGDGSLSLSANGPEIYIGPVDSPTFVPGDFSLTGNYSTELFDPGVSGAITLAITAPAGLVATTVFEITGPVDMQITAPYAPPPVSEPVPMLVRSERSDWGGGAVGYVWYIMHMANLIIYTLPPQDFVAPPTTFARSLANTTPAPEILGMLQMDRPLPLDANGHFSPQSFTFNGTYTDRDGDEFSGLFSAVGKVGPYLQADFATTAVPEPSNWAMLIMGFGTIGTLSRRRRALCIKMD